MRARTWSVLAMGVVLALASTPSSAAERGVMVGPARSYIPESSPAKLLVSNPSSNRVKIVAEAMAYEDGWTSLPVGMSMTPSSFVLQPGDQQEVTVSSDLSPTRPCALYGVGFTASAPGPSSGVVVQGQVIAQLLLRDDAASEADCAAILPKPPTAPAPAGSDGPLIAGGALVAALVIGGTLLVAGRKKRKRPAYGF